MRGYSRAAVSKLAVSLSIRLLPPPLLSDPVLEKTLRVSPPGDVERHVPVACVQIGSGQALLWECRSAAAAGGSSVSGEDHERQQKCNTGPAKHLGDPRVHLIL